MKRAPIRISNIIAGTLVLCGATSLSSYASAPTWTPASSGIPAAREGAVFVTDEARQAAVLFGGYSGVLQNDTWIFDGNKWTKANPAQSPAARQSAAFAYDPDIAKVVLFGGAGGQISGVSGVEILGDTWTWDGTNWTQASAGDPTGLTEPGLRSDASMAYDPNRHQLILFGGWNGNYAQYLNDTWTFDGQSWTQLHPANSPPGRSGAMIAYDPSLGQIVLFGGSSVTGGVMGDMWTWNGSNWVQLTPDTLPGRRYGASLVLDRAHNTLVLYGGINASGQTIGDTWIWNGTTWQIQNPFTVPVVRSQAALAYLPSIQQLVLFSGVITAFEFPQDLWTWDGANWNQLSLPPLGRFDPTMAWDPQLGAVILFGGQSVTAPTGPGFLNDTWIWDGTSWQEQYPVSSPSPRNSAGLVYDPAIGKTVLFGGLGDFILGDTWLWDGVDWTFLSPSHLPPGREDPLMVYDAALGKIVLFGGQGPFDTNRGTSYFGDTWSFDGSDWTELQSEDLTGTSAPSRRSLVAAAYDPVKQVVVLFGGQADTAGNVSIARGDTWTFDGTSWTRVLMDDLTGTTAPTPRYGARMEYDPVAGGLILFGGLDNASNYLNETWKWDGTAWSKLQPAASPGGRELFGSAYDFVRQQIVLFGGGSSTNAFNSDTWLFGLPPVQLVKTSSRKVHGSAGTFDIDISSGEIECRANAENGNYTLIFTFANPLTGVGGASVTHGTGSMSTSNVDPNDAHNYIVNLTGVTNAQTITVSLTNVSDSVGNFSAVVTGSMKVLIGDVNGTGVVDSGDVFLVRQHTGQSANSSNFREDVNASGLIDSGDVFLTRQKTSTSMP